MEVLGILFVLGMCILLRECWDVMFVVYVFCREIDDIVDEDGIWDEKLIVLIDWWEEIECIY